MRSGVLRLRLFHPRSDIIVNDVREMFQGVFVIGGDGDVFKQPKMNPLRDRYIAIARSYGIGVYTGIHYTQSLQFGRDNYHW